MILKTYWTAASKKRLLKMRTRIQFRESILNKFPIAGFLHYPHSPFDLAIIWDGKKMHLKPIIAVRGDEGYFTYRGKALFLKFFRHQDDGTIIPDWALQWVQDIIDNKEFEVDAKLSTEDKIMFDRMIRNKKSILEKQLSSLDNDY